MSGSLLDPDDLLLAELGSAIAAHDPLPRDVDVAAKAILGWRRLDADLAELLADSTVDSELLAGTRGAGEPRRLAFGGAAVELDLELHAAREVVTVMGQLAPGAEAAIAVHAPGGTEPTLSVQADDLGRFRLELPAGITFRLAVSGHPAAADRSIVTDWVRI